MKVSEEKLLQSISEVSSHYEIGGRMVSAARIGNGHINDTFRVIYAESSGTKSYTFQKVNDFVFAKPEIIMDNIRIVSDYINEKYGENSPAANMVLRFLYTKDGKNYVKGENNGFWRVSSYVDADTYESISDGKVLYNTGYAFGRFQDILSGLDASKLTETIPDFHNTRKRTEAFFEGVERDEAGRVSECVPEIKFFEKYRNDFSRLVELHECGILPYRVTHNDTKFNNILIDKNTGNPMRVLDLDTVMPGLVAYDFGDAVRCGANNTEEDERDLSKVGLNFDYYEQFTRGYITAVKPFLTVSEKDSLALSAMTIAYELASRFMLDYLNGDKYFKIGYEKHNLDRARCQIRLCEDMMANYGKMCSVVDKYYN